MKRRNIKHVPIDTSLSFQDKEDCIYRGLLVYLGNAVGEFISRNMQLCVRSPCGSV